MSTPDVDLGKKIALIRKKHKITIRDLAKNVGVSASMLSQIERGLANPSIATMKSIADALHEPLYNFFLPDISQEDNIISRAASRRKYTLPPSNGIGMVSSLPTGYECELLSCPECAMESLRITLPPHSTSNPIPRLHLEPECAYVEAGTVKIELGDTTAALYPHDAVSIPANLPHRWLNESDDTVCLILTSIKSTQ